MTFSSVCLVFLIFLSFENICRCKIFRVLFFSHHFLCLWLDVDHSGLGLSTKLLGPQLKIKIWYNKGYSSILEVNEKLQLEMIRIKKYSVISKLFS